MEILVATIWTALALFLLYETSAVFSYLSLSALRPLNFLTKIKEFNEFQKQSYETVYSDYMQTYHGGFFVRLVSCRYCLGFWLALGFSCLTGKPEWTPVTYFGGQLLCSGFKRLNEWMVNHE